jgi:hypothetical protein
MANMFNLYIVAIGNGQQNIEIITKYYPLTVGDPVLNFINKFM